jgi:hypothetical protein
MTKKINWLPHKVATFLFGSPSMLKLYFFWINDAINQNQMSVEKAIRLINPTALP